MLADVLFIFEADEAGKTVQGRQTEEHTPTTTTFCYIFLNFLPEKPFFVFRPSLFWTFPKLCRRFTTTSVASTSLLAVRQHSSTQRTEQYQDAAQEPKDVLRWWKKVINM